MKTARGDQISKRVEFTAKDDTEQIATGIVMVPNKVDLQGDWETPETIRAFADQFESLESVGEADGGVMHAVWPTEHTQLERNEIIEEPTSINGQDVPEGAWVQSWKFQDEELWGLVSDGILQGYSIGAVDVAWEGPLMQEELPDDVSVPEGFPEDEPVWELVDGIIREVSAVDIPAVPDAMILETKSAYEKRLADHLGNRDGFIEEALERGHSEAEAERLWEYLNRAVDVEGAGEPGTKDSRLTSAAKAFLNALTGSDDGTTATTPAAASKSEAQDASSGKDDTGGDTPDNNTSTSGGGSDMSKDNNPDEPPEWAKELQEQINEQSKRIDDALENASDGAGESTEGKDAFEDAPEWAKALKDDVDKQAERIDAISKQTGATESQQLGGAEKNGDSGEDGLTERQAFFIPESKRRA